MFGRKKKVNESDKSELDVSEKLEDEVEKGTDDKEEVNKESTKDIKESTVGVEEKGGEEVEEEITERALLVIIDKEIPRLRDYFNSLGISVDTVYSEIEDARDDMLLFDDAYRMVVIETGTGKFTNSTTREEMVEFISSVDEIGRVTVFETSAKLRTEARRMVEDKNILNSIDWFKYEGTPKVAEKLLEYGERYIGREVENEEFNQDEIMNDKGVGVKPNEVNNKEFKPEYTTFDLNKVLVEKDIGNTIKSYKLGFIEKLGEEVGKEKVEEKEGI